MFSLYLHDAVYMYALATDELFKEGGYKRNGSRIFEIAKNKTFQGEEQFILRKKLLNTNPSYACPVNSKINSNVAFVFSFLCLKSWRKWSQLLVLTESYHWVSFYSYVFGCALRPLQVYRVQCSLIPMETELEITGCGIFHREDPLMKNGVKWGWRTEKLEMRLV